MNFNGVFVYFSALSFVLSFVCLVFTPFVLQGKEVSSGVYSYQEAVGEVILPFEWKVEIKEQYRIVSVYEKNKSFINECLIDGSTWQWQLKDGEKHNIIAERHDNELKISGIRNGESYKKTVQIDDRPWYQPLSYSLKNFLISKDKSMSFWTIRADNVEVTTLNVEKMDDEDILINKKLILAQKVEVRAEGFYSYFWHGTYWYRKTDKLFLMYRSVHGPPGTTETVVELIGEPRSHSASMPSEQ